MLKTSIPPEGGPASHKEPPATTMTRRGVFAILTSLALQACGGGGSDTPAAMKLDKSNAIELPGVTFPAKPSLQPGSDSKGNPLHYDSTRISIPPELLAQSVNAILPVEGDDNHLGISFYRDTNTIYVSNDIDRSPGSSIEIWAILQRMEGNATTKVADVRFRINFK